MRESPERIRKPGEGFDLTDEEIVNAPARLLTREQRVRRRRLKNNIAKEKTRARRKERRANGEAKIKYCQGFKGNGEECLGYAVAGAKHCLAHLTDEERERLNLVRGTKQGPSGLASTVSAPQLMREITEVAAEKLLARYFSALGLEFVGFDDDGNPVIFDQGAEKGIRIYGESKDGDVVMTDYPDLAAQVQVMEKLLDRVYGRARQTQVIEGGQRPIQVQPVRTVDRAQRVGSLLAHVGAVRDPNRPALEPAVDVPASDVEHVEGEVVPLHTPDGEGS